MEQLEQWVDRLSGAKPIDPETVDELVVRLLTGVITLLTQHEVNKRGQCNFCGWTKWRWRLWRPRRKCTVFQAVDRALSESADVVWWELLRNVGREVELKRVREWLNS